MLIIVKPRGRVHHTDRPTVLAGLAPVVRGHRLELAGVGLEGDRRAERLHQCAGGHPVRTAGPCDGRRDPTGDLEPLPAGGGDVPASTGQPDRRHAAAQADADERVLHLAEPDAGVVVLEDLLVGGAVLGVAVGAPLRHADAVSPAAADHGDVRGRRPRRHGEGQHREERRGEHAERGAAAPRSAAAVGAGTPVGAVCVGSMGRRPRGREWPPSILRGGPRRGKPRPWCRPPFSYRPMTPARERLSALATALAPFVPGGGSLVPPAKAVQAPQRDRGSSGPAARR